MMSIYAVSNAARWNCHDGTNRGSRFPCIRQQLRPPAGPILCAASAHSRVRPTCFGSMPRRPYTGPPKP